ncbi:RHS repeat-associated core domain-containing protein [Actinoplanes sp. NPDC049118]|uniref:RHS repeat-associated core domain-containing protein n=1 Tax=Actinoplanes sp. NPDC049118 TaxID=3155769 RepID=UPI0033E9D829
MRRRALALVLTGTLVATLSPAQAVAATRPLRGGEPAKAVPAAAAGGPARSTGPVRQARLAPPGPARYAYDAAGRLVGVTQPSGETARYAYDAAGNTVGVDRFPSSRLSVLSVVPAAAPPGASVTITGTGFASTAAGNTVTFGGNAAARVASASPTSLTVEVPASAATGAIRVAADGSTTDSASFSVLPGGPEITAMTPASGQAGTEVTLTGRNFDQTLGNDVVTLGGQAVNLVSATATTLRFRVPDGATGGRVQVASPRGTATSAVDFFVPPATVDPALVESYARAEIGGTSAVRIGAAGKVAVLLFDAPVGQNLSIGVSDIAATFAGAISARVISPDGLDVPGGSDAHTTAFDLDLRGLRAGQTYALVIDPRSDTGTGSLSVSFSEPLGGELTATGDAVTKATSLPGQDIQLSFDADQGDAVSLGFTGNSLPNSADVYVAGPTGEPVGARWVLSARSTKSLDIAALPMNGAYRVVIDEDSAATGSITVTLSRWASAGEVTRGGAARTATITRAGQNAEAYFDGTAGQTAGLGLTGNTLSAGADVTLLGPDNAPVNGPDGRPLKERLTAGESGALQLQQLPATGRYRVVVAPDAVGTGAITVTHSAQIDGGTVTHDGDAVAVTVQRAGQDAAVGFQATNGERPSVLIDNAFAASVYAYVYGPDGRQVGDRLSVSRNAVRDLDLPPLGPGRHRIVIAPTNAAVGTARVSLSTELDGGTLDVGGAARTVAFARRGQNARLSFSPTSAQRQLRLNVSANGLPSYTSATLYDPAGTNLGRVDLRNLTGADLPDLPGTAVGTYQLVLNPNTAGTGALTLALATRSAGSGGGAMMPAAAPAAPAVLPAAPDTPTGSDPTTWTPDAINLTGADWLARRQSHEAPDPLRAPARTTAVSGHMLKLDGTPLVGASASIAGVRTTTDRHGRFLLAGVRPGDATLVVDGTPAGTGADRYGVFEIKVTARAGRTTVLPYTVWMQRLDTEHMVRIDAPIAKDLVLTTPKIPGLEVRIPAGSVIRDRAGKVVHELGITPIPLDRAPFPLPTNGIVPTYFTVQPGGASVFPSGAQIIYPNYTKLAPYTRVDFWGYDPEGKGWHVYGRGEVSADGRQVVPDPKTRVWSFTGAMFNSASRPGWLESIFTDAMDWLDGDPVDLSTGRLTDSHTDLAVSDTFPIAVTRNYWQADDDRRDFGVGWLSQYGMFFHSEDQYDEVDLYLPGGRKVHFVRTSEATGFDKVVLEAVDTTGEWRGARVKYAKDPAFGDNRGWVLTRRDGMVFTIPLYGALAAVRDRNGNQISLSYDGNRLTQVTSPNGRWIRFTHDNRNRITSATDNVGRAVAYTYNGQGLLETVTDPAGKVSRYTYDAEKRLKTATDARNVTYLVNEYDANGRVQKQTLPGNVVYQFAYELSAAGKVTATRVTQPDGTVRRVEFNAAGAAVSDTAAYGTAAQATTRYERSAHQQITAVVDPLNRRTRYDYDAEGRLEDVFQLEGEDGRRRVAHYVYGGPYDQPLFVHGLGDQKTGYTYEQDGDLQTVTDPMNRTTRFTYTGAGQVRTVTDPADKVTTLDYRGGDLASVTDPLRRVVRQFTDAAGRPIAVTDAAGAETRLRYDSLNQVKQVSDALGATTALDYDENGNLTGITDARNNRTSWQYGPSDQVSVATDPLTKADTWQYDNAGRVQQFESRGRHVTGIVPDPLRRITEVTYGKGTPDASAVTHGYDAVGRPVSITEGLNEVTSIGWDRLDRLTRIQSSRSSVDYGYDPVDRRENLKIDGRVVTRYAYDDDNTLRRIEQGDDVVEVEQRDATGRPTTVRLPGGWSRTTSYDDAGQVLGLAYRHGGADKGTLTYAYDPAGRVASVEGSLARIDLPAARTGLQYDAANRLTSAGGHSLTYDADGNLLGYGNTAYYWNNRGQLTGTGRPESSEAYRYDAFGRRTDRSAGTDGTATVSDGTDPVQERSGPRTTDLMAGGTDEWFSRRDSGGQRTYLTDLTGSTVALGDSAGALRAEYAYDPHGVQTRTGEATSNRFSWTGRERDDSGLSYHRARYYDPQLQRFISEDPIGPAGGLNQYAYAGNSPTNATDPSGNSPLLVGCLVGGFTDGALDYVGQRLSGRKVDWGWGGVGGSAALGCASGLAGAVFARLGKGAKAAGCMANSFAPDTLVLMADGSRKRIADVRPGDRVLAAPENDPDATPVAATVTTSITGTGDKDLVDISVAGGEPITATAGHPFWLPREHRWVEAGDLAAGSLLRTSSGTYVQVTAVSDRSSRTTVHNLTVAGEHTFYVVANGAAVLVHNINTPIGCSLGGRQPFYEIPAGSAGGRGAGQRITGGMLGDYNIGVNARGGPAPLCSYCRTNSATSLDHVTARVRGGDLTDANITPACTFCNSSKGARGGPVNLPPNVVEPFIPPWFVKLGP